MHAQILPKNVWRRLESLGGFVFEDDFKESYSNTRAFSDLCNQVKTKGNSASPLIAGVFMSYRDWQLAQTNLEEKEADDSFNPTRARMKVPRGQADEQPRAADGLWFPSDRSGAISAMLNQLARLEFGTLIGEILKLASEKGIRKVSLLQNEATTFLRTSAALELRFANQEAPDLETDELELDQFLESAEKRLQTEGKAVFEQHQKLRRIHRDRKQLRRLRSVASQIASAIERRIESSDRSLHEVLAKADKEWLKLGQWQTIRIFENWTGSTAEAVAFNSECLFMTSLKRLAIHMAANFGWTEEHALAFILFRVSPPVGLIRVQYRMRRDLPILSKVILEIEPGTPEDEVRQAYSRARRHLLPTGSKGDKTKSRVTPKPTLGIKQLSLAAHVFGNRLKSKDEPHLSWKDLLEEWNQDYAPKLKNIKSHGGSADTPAKSARFEHLSHFKRAAKIAKQTLLFPEYKVVNVEGLFLAGSRLGALDDLE